MDYFELLKSKDLENIVNALDLTKLNEYSQNTRIMVWAYNKIESMRKQVKDLENHAYSENNHILSHKKMNDDLEKIVERQYSEIRDLGKTINDHESTNDDLEREVVEYELIQEDNKRFFMYIVVISVFAGFMMGLLAYTLI